MTCVCTFVWDENCGLLCLVCTDVLDENLGSLPVCCGLWVQKVSLVGILGAAETLFDRDPGIVVRNLFGLTFRVLRTLAASADNFPNRASSTSENAHCALAQRSTETGEKSGCMEYHIACRRLVQSTVQYKTTID